MNVKQLFDLTGKVAIVTGGAGLLGPIHAEAILEAGGSVVLADINRERQEKVIDSLRRVFPTQKIFGFPTDVTDKAQVHKLVQQTKEQAGRIDILVNNAANNPKVEELKAAAWARFEDFPLELWQDDLDVGLTGAFLCSQAVGAHMANNGGGVIVNIASQLGLVAPDHRIYERPELPPEKQPIKAASYSGIKAGLISLTRYLATYWADKNIRANSLTPGGVYNEQDPQFVKNYASRTPLGRMARKDEYKGPLLFLCSDASSYMTGANLVVDGGWVCW